MNGSRPPHAAKHHRKAFEFQDAAVNQVKQENKTKTLTRAFSFFKKCAASAASAVVAGASLA